MCIKQQTAHCRVTGSVLRGGRLRYVRGTTLIELIVFIVIVSAALAGILKVMTLTTGHSSDTLLRKQSLAIATSLLEEIELMPFTYCDPTDVNAASAVSTAGCTAGLSQDVITGPTPGTATRSSITSPFNNVADYSNYQMSPSLTNGIVDVTGTVVSGLNKYSASVAISRAGTSFLGAADDGAALQIMVTVTAPDGNTVVLDGYRARYAPNSF
jgi:MSHA pilin protein MshD